LHSLPDSHRRKSGQSRIFFLARNESLGGDGVEASSVKCKQFTRARRNAHHSSTACRGLTTLLCKHNETGIDCVEGRELSRMCSMKPTVGSVLIERGARA
jgi:hypothetical protein